jgi:hypothetical protein
MLCLGLSTTFEGLPVLEGTPDERFKESAFSTFCALFFAAIALARRSCNRSLVLLVDGAREIPRVELLAHWDNELKVESPTFWF